jgi:hypothetical protein
MEPPGQMIPHHSNAVNMAKAVLKLASQADLDLAEGMEEILWGALYHKATHNLIIIILMPFTVGDSLRGLGHHRRLIHAFMIMCTGIINVQNFEIHQFRNYLAGHVGYTAIDDPAAPDNKLNAESLGTHCTQDKPVIAALAAQAAGTSGTVAGCVPSATNLCMKLNVFASETGYYEFEGKSGSSPDLTVEIGTTYTFDQSDASNWYHPVGFAYEPDGAHGATWGGAELPEIEGQDQLQVRSKLSAMSGDLLLSN